MIFFKKYIDAGFRATQKRGRQSDPLLKHLDSIEKKLGDLNDLDYAMINMHYEGMHIDEISSYLKLSRSEVSTSLFRIKNDILPTQDFYKKEMVLDKGKSSNLPLRSLERADVGS